MEGSRNTCRLYTKTYFTLHSEGYWRTKASISAMQIFVYHRSKRRAWRVPVTQRMTVRTRQEAVVDADPPASGQWYEQVETN